jgi:hypothetical protein
MRNKARLLWHIELATLLACGLLLMSVVAAAQGGRCMARVELVLDSEVSDPRNPGFVSSLTGSPLYSLSWIEGEGSRVVYDLTGPGSDEMCKGGIEMLRRDAAVLDLRVLEPGLSN